MSVSEDSRLHKLQNSWVIYEQVQFHQEKDRKTGYFNSFESICKFKTVEGFWMNWNRIPSVTNLFYDGESRIIKRMDDADTEEIPRDISIEGQSLFKEGITPKWEDAQNEKGGELRVSFDVSAHDTLGKFWETIVLIMIGETMDESDDICGARILDKSKPNKRIIGYRLELWFDDWKNEELKKRLETRIRGILNDFHFENMSIVFEEHKAGKW